MEKILETQDLCFNHKIHYPNIAISKEGANFITGASGCGKSTLLRLINKTISPSKGKIVYNKNDILQMDAITLRREILLISQSIYLFDESIRENFNQYYSYRQLEPPTNDSIKQYLDICGASFSPDMNCTNMSGGERQRVYLAIFISFLPKIILLDEPTSALDTVTAHSVLKNIKQFCENKKISLAIVSHDKALCSQFADFHISL